MGDNALHFGRSCWVQHYLALSSMRLKSHPQTSDQLTWQINNTGKFLFFSDNQRALMWSSLGQQCLVWFATCTTGLFEIATLWAVTKQSDQFHQRWAVNCEHLHAVAPLEMHAGYWTQLVQYTVENCRMTFHHVQNGCQSFRSQKYIFFLEKNCFIPQAK